MTLLYNEQFMFFSVCLYCTESPAGATIHLVFNASHIAMVPPVHSVWKISSFSLLEKCSCTMTIGAVEGSQAAFHHFLSVLLVILGRKIEEITAVKPCVSSVTFQHCVVQRF